MTDTQIKDKEEQHQAVDRQLELKLEQWEIRPTPRRFIILFLFCFNSGNKAFQWMEIPAATQKLSNFYGVQNFIINATSVVFMLSFVVLSIPACYFIEKIGMRKAVLLASLGTAMGSLIKCFSCNPDGIWTLFIGQLIVSLSEQLIFSVPSRLVSIWFPDHQVSSALATCMLGNQLGVAIGFILPQLWLAEAESSDDIAKTMSLIFRYTCAASWLALLADWWLFDEAPKWAPGEARLRQLQEEQNWSVEAAAIMVGPQARQLMRQKDFVLLALSYGINIGLSYAVSTLLDQMLEPIWPNNGWLIGNTGFLIIMASAFSSPIWGRLLDWLHWYQALNITLTLGCLLALGLVGFAAGSVQFRSVWLLYTAALLYGSFYAGLLVAGLELAVELTYPAPELISSTIMNFWPQIFGSIMVFVGSYIIDNYGLISVICFFLVSVLLALIMLLQVKPKLKRQQAVCATKENQDMKKLDIC